MSEWPTFPLGAVTTKIGSGATPRGGQKSYKTEGTPLIRSLNVHDRQFKEAKLAFLDTTQASQLANVTVEEGDVLLNITGASIARCCVAPPHFLPARVNQHVSILRPKSEQIISGYLCYLLTSPTCKEDLLSTGEAAGATRQALTKSQLQTYTIPVPPLPEQERIVAILDEAFEGIATATAHAERNLHNARELFQSVLQSTFEQKGEDWVEKSLSDVCAIVTKLVDPRESSVIDQIHVGAGNIESITGSLSNLLTAREEKLISGKFPFDSSMILYSKIRPYLMKVARPDFAGICSADMYPLAPNNFELDRDFLFHLLLTKGFTDYAIEGSNRAGMPKVNRTHLFTYRFYLPPLAQQKAIVEKLDALSAETRRLEAIYRRKLDALAELKQSLLQKAFAGEL